MPDNNLPARNLPSPLQSYDLTQSPTPEQKADIRRKMLSAPLTWAEKERFGQWRDVIDAAFRARIGRDLYLLAQKQGDAGRASGRRANHRGHHRHQPSRAQREHRHCERGAERHLYRERRAADPVERPDGVGRRQPQSI